MSPTINPTVNQDLARGALAASLALVERCNVLGIVGAIVASRMVLHLAKGREISG